MEDLDILAAFKGITPYGHPWEPGPGKAHELGQASRVMEELRAYCTQVVSIANDMPGLKIVSDFKRLDQINTVEKNICWLTTASVDLLPALKFTVDGDDPETYDELLHKEIEIKERIAKYERTRREKILIPLPRAIEAYNGTYDYTTQYNDFAETVLKAAFSNEYLAQQFTEISNGLTPSGVIELLLPRVAMIPFDEVLNLRRELAPNFMRFQNEMLRLLQSSKAADSETRLVELLGRIDEETRLLASEVERFDRTRRLEQVGLVYSFGVLSLVLFLPSEVFKSLAALLGSTSILKTVRNLRLLAISRRELADSPFYLPFLLTKLSEQYGSGSFEAWNADEDAR